MKDLLLKTAQQTGIADADGVVVVTHALTEEGGEALARQLEQAGLVAEAIHGNKSQNARTRALSRFKDGEARGLVATDVTPASASSASCSARCARSRYPWLPRTESPRRGGAYSTTPLPRGQPPQRA